jgi:hypothetical protein
VAEAAGDRGGGGVEGELQMDRGGPFCDASL